MNGANVIGQTLDDKYKIESEIGKGGMGTVYLATHVGTERPVALKIIAPEFMQRLEFVERFKREARAAGRLRHPNVVNVTDFGFAGTSNGSVAYLVMEYLDGCTLGEILEEEGKLPLAWTLDILEQVCSAVQEAHEQGIIHRDLKPDNIWLEPNQRGGYTVKVLDFGIAKLEEQLPKMPSANANNLFALTENFQSRTTVADASNSGTVAENGSQTAAIEAKTIADNFQSNSESGTLIQSNDVNSESGTLIQSSETVSESGTLIQSKEINLEAGTAILSAPPIRTLKSIENGGTKIITAVIGQSSAEADSTANLTRVGAVLGTPLYMSPEQCRGEKLSRQSDIYSLGVIAYQMLSGKTPFSGDYRLVMDSHRETAPPPLEAKRVPKKTKQVIAAALAKEVEQRPPTALAFASELRAQSEGIGALYRRALVIYSEHLPKFIGLTILLYIPVIFITLAQLAISFLAVSGDINDPTEIGLSLLATLLSAFLAMFCGYLIFGTITWLVAQILAVPLRPVKIRPALEMTRRRWKTFAGTGMMSATLVLIGYVLCVIPGLYCSVFFALVAPVVMMENLRGFDALKRSKTLVKRSLRTTVATIIIMFFVPLAGSGLIAFVANATSKTFSATANKIDVVRKEAAEMVTADENADAPVPPEAEKKNVVKVVVNGKDVNLSEPIEPKNMGEKIRITVREVLTQLLMLPFQIFIASFSSIVVALLYMKTRQVGGESMQDLLEQFEESEQPRTNWQKRVKARLEQSGKQTSRS
ncbi:MAG: protein kinase [Acidobacteriota bacterium]|nr:protein kinase [Acidobacteriota bacterium]